MELIKPMLCKSADAPFESDDWVFEFKLDGERVLLYKELDYVRLFNRHDVELTDTFPEVVGAARSLIKAQSVVLDGELYALDADNVPHLNLIQMRPPGGPVRYAVFDILFCNGQNTMPLTYRSRMELLDAVLPFGASVYRLGASAGAGAGGATYDLALSLGYEGVVAKRIDSRYIPGTRSHNWLKIKRSAFEYFTIGGFTWGKGSRRIGALVLVDREGKYITKVGSGFNDGELDEIVRRLTVIATIPDMVVVAPEFELPVRFTERTDAGSLRHSRAIGPIRRRE